uniref:hypothetical protein n=1 Tax=Marinobacterium profundum TaxID=1714300 RepID=UPI00082D79DC|nr:hypothetical protein [Marinobacterium profundum]
MDRLAQERLKKEFSLPGGTKCLGYVINEERSDEYLHSFNENDYLYSWYWTIRPELAFRFKKLHSAKKAKQGYTKRATIICYLFETPTHFFVTPVEGEIKEWV